jgi:hypothetical protein
LKPKEYLLKLYVNQKTKSLDELADTKNITDYYCLLKKVLKNHLIYCQQCDSSIAQQIHHKDRNRKNNNLENLIAVCMNCHRIYFHHKDSRKRQKYIRKIFINNLKTNKIIIENYKEPTIMDFNNFLNTKEFQEKMIKIIIKANEKWKKKSN